MISNNNFIGQYLEFSIKLILFQTFGFITTLNNLL